MKVFEMSLSINKEEKSTEVHCGSNEEDFDPEALEMIKILIADVTKLITIAYLHKVVNFSDNSKAEKGGEA